MRKLLLLSVLAALILIPILASREKSSRQAVKKTALLVFLFNLFFLIALALIYSHVQ